MKHYPKDNTMADNFFTRTCGQHVLYVLEGNAKMAQIQTKNEANKKKKKLTKPMKYELPKRQKQQREEKQNPTPTGNLGQVRQLCVL
jgi:hypothetical protein